MQRRGDVSQWERWATDVEEYLASLPDELPRTLMGISWGGILTTAVARRRPDLLSSIGLICPGLFSQKGTTVFQRTAVELLGATRLREKYVTIPLQEPSWFTNSRNDQAYIASDPLTLRKITLRFAKANLRLGAFARGEGNPISVPTLLMLAGNDPIIDNEKTREFFSRIDVPTKQLIEYRGMYHTLEFEPNPENYFADLANWVEASC